MAEVVLHRVAKKQLTRIPDYIQINFYEWLATVENYGLSHMRTCKAFRDEPLQGKRWGQRSIRLNRAYRVIYKELSKGGIELLEVLEVNKHEY